ncbi:MAG: alkaline phosphatase family protein [Ignavibacteriaceae bacterium]|nr:alkaline phosphatase family protein [Ignavibacteriaceae bacterium]
MKLFKPFFIFFIFFSSLLSAQTEYVILISFDGFRWDYPNRGLTPNLDFIEKEGVKALSLQPCFPSKTFPNHYSIITGLYPQNHGIIFNSFKNPYSGKEYRISDTASVRNSSWYLGEAFWETAKRQGIKTASYFWPGSEMDLSYRRPDYFEKYDHKRPYDQRIKGVIDWLKLPYNQRPHFITAYFDATDSYGHKFGTGTDETNFAISTLDSVVGKLISELKSISLLDSTNLIIVSDHGMSNVSSERTINIKDIIKDSGCRFYDSGPTMMIQPPESKLEEIFGILKKNENHFKVYKREDIPAHLNFSKNPFILELFLLAEPGWSLISSDKNEEYNNRQSGGNHGYDNHFIEMHGIFYAIGPSFKKGYKTGTVQNIDIYPLLCAILDVTGRQNIDGKIERVEFLLNEK